MKLLLLAILPFLLIIGILLSFGLYQTWETGRGKSYNLFLSGSLPDPLPDGKFIGSAHFNTGPWVGKTFNQKDKSGINNFEGENFHYYDAFPFKTSSGKGLRDRGLDVMKIDYNIPGNNWLVRSVMDEIVQIAPGKYLGKMHVRIIPGLFFTIAYFELEK